MPIPSILSTRNGTGSVSGYRDDLVAGDLVGLSLSNYVGITSVLWELIGRPEGSTAGGAGPEPILLATANSTAFNVDSDSGDFRLDGTYTVQATLNPGSPGQLRITTVLCRLSGLTIPGPGSSVRVLRKLGGFEALEDTSVPTVLQGWATELNRWLELLRETVSGGAGGFTTLAGAYSHGASSSDQTMVLHDSLGGGIVVDGSQSNFTGASALRVNTAAGGPVVVDRATGRVGIGIAAPLQAVHAKGTAPAVRLDRTGGAALDMMNVVDDLQFLNGATVLGIFKSTGGLQADLGVGIGTPPATHPVLALGAASTSPVSAAGTTRFRYNEITGHAEWSENGGPYMPFSSPFSAYQTVDAAGTPLTQRTVLNFGAEFGAVDNSGASRTDVSIASIASSKITGTADTIPYFNGAGAMTENAAQLSFDPTNFRVGLRVPGAAPSYQLHLVSQSADADYANRGVTNTVYNGGATSSPLFRMQTAGGSFASPAAVTATMYTGTLRYEAWDGATFVPAIQVGAHVLPGATVATNSVPSVWYADSKSGGASDPFGTRSIFLSGAGSVSISSGVSTWEFDDGAFTGADLGRSFQVLGATNAGNNNFFQIYQVVDSTHVKTVQHTSPNVNETFSRPAVTVAMGVGILATQVFPIATAAGTNFRGTVTNQVAISGQAGVLPYQGDGSGATPAALQIYGGGQIIADTSSNLIPAYSFNGVYGAGMSAALGGGLIFYTGGTQATAVASMQMRSDIGVDLLYAASGQPAKVRWIGGLSEFPVTWARSTPGAGTLHLESSTSNHTGVLEVGIGNQADKFAMSFAGGSGSTAVLSSTNAISITPTGNFAVTTLVGPGFVKANASGVFSVDTSTYLTSAFYQTIDAAGTPLTQRLTLNFDGTVVAVDNSGASRTDIGLPNVGPGAGTIGTAGIATVTLDAQGRVTGATTATYLTGNQTITLSGDVTGSGATAITTTLANIPTATPAAGYVQFTNIAAPSTPAAGKTRVFVDSTAKNLAAINDAGILTYGAQVNTGTAHQFFTAFSSAGAFTLAQPAFTDISGTVATSQIAASAVTYAKIQNEGASTLLGNPTGSPAAPSEITLGTNLSFSGSVLNATGGGGFYQTIDNAGSPLTQRNIWNASTGLTAVDNSGAARTDVTVNLSTGVSGGQTAIGGTASGNNLTLSSTSNATKGQVIFGTTSGLYFDEANNLLIMGTNSPASGVTVEVSKSQNSSNAFAFVNPNAGGSAFGQFILGNAVALNTATFQMALFGSGSTRSDIQQANYGVVELAGGSGDMTFWVAQSSGDISFATGTAFPTVPKFKIKNSGALRGINTTTVSYTSASSELVPTAPTVFEYAVTPSLTASAASLGALHSWDAVTLTLTGSTHHTGSNLALARFVAPTVTDASAVTIDAMATLTVTGAPASAGSVTLTSAYALWVQGGGIRLDGLGATGFVKNTNGGILSIDTSTYLTQAYSTVQQAGAGLTQRSTLNFSADFSAVDNSGSVRTDVSLANVGPGSGTIGGGGTQFINSVALDARGRVTAATAVNLNTLATWDIALSSGSFLITTTTSPGVSGGSWLGQGYVSPSAGPALEWSVDGYGTGTTVGIQINMLTNTFTDTVTYTVTKNGSATGAAVTFTSGTTGVSGNRAVLAWTVGDMFGIRMTSTNPLIGTSGPILVTGGIFLGIG